MLRTLLDSLRASLKTERVRVVAIVVIDNDVDGSARAIAGEFTSTFGDLLRYERVPERNIAIARNAAVNQALQTGAEFVAFVDDDCVASPQWLVELVQAAVEHGADVVWGRRDFNFEDDVPAWLKGGFYSNNRRRTGQQMRTAESNNVLLRASLLGSLREPFAREFGLAGGSDSLLFMRARLAGARIVWADRALVTETVPNSRATLRWMLQRSFREGNCGVFVHRAALPVLRWLPGRILKAAGHVVVGSALLAAGALRGRKGMIRPLRRMALGVGIASGLLGYKYVEYRTTHGA